MKSTMAVILLSILTSCSNNIGSNSKNNITDKIFQYSSKKALITNHYVGNLTVAEIKENGNFGLGTFNMIDGEMVISENNVYQVLPNGEVNNMQADTKSPFVVTKYFEADTTFSITDLSLNSLKKMLEPVLSNLSTPFAIKIIGKYKTLKSRSVDKVANESVSLDEIIANQTIFDFTNVEGTLIGFWFPEYFDGVNFAEYHLHALLNDFSGGGHLLDCNFEGAVVEIDFASGVIVQL